MPEIDFTISRCFRAVEQRKPSLCFTISLGGGLYGFVR